MRCFFGIHKWAVVASSQWQVRNLWEGRPIGTTYETQYLYKCDRCPKRKVVTVKGVW